MNLYYLHFNNYYNRIVKKFDTLAEYLTLPYYDNVATNDIAFNPNDGVDTKQVANIPVGNEFTYDYAILADGNTIVSRWFIIDANRNRNGQYTLTLRRDMFADSYEPVLDAPAFIEKATLNNNDPMIFNSENMTFNQIKTAEYLLKDSSNCPWIVGYLNKDTTTDVNTVVYNTPEVYANYSEFTTTFYSMCSSGLNRDVVIPANPDFYFKIPVYESVKDRYYRFTIDPTGSNTGVVDSSITSASLIASNGAAALSRYGELIKSNQTQIKELINTGYRTTTQINQLLQYDGKIVYNQDDTKYYKVKIKSEYSDEIYPQYSLTPSIQSYMEQITSQNTYMSGSSDANSYKLFLKTVYYTYSLEEVSGESVKYKFNAGKNNLQDAPYKMFAIPYGGITVKYEDGSITKTLTISESDGKSIALSVAFDIANNLGSETNNSLYDLQLLPYCPIPSAVVDEELNLSSDNFFDLIESSDGSKNVGVIIYPTESRFTFNIPYSVPITETKIQSECDMYRLCSPNWNGQFEFNAAKNGGINKINVDCEYKPFSPYIHLNPDFKQLYGQDFNDARGLICSGDFSLSQTSNAWATYERQNVNYQKTFDRQIQNMKVSNRLQNIQADIQGAAGVVGGVLGGAMAGGGGVGSIVGGVLGGVASAGAAAGDAVIRRQAQAEAIDYTKDQFGYSLGNIKALPDSLTKVSAFNNNNKIFPVLEFYTCTNEEKLALENKIKYNGMTVMRIGTIREFLQEEPTYIKGKLIRMENLLEDFHYVNELANEFNKGVFI